MSLQNWYATQSLPHVTSVALRLAASFQLLMMTATWKLWLTPGSFPVVPLLRLNLSPDLIPAATLPLAAGCLLLALNVAGNARAVQRSIVLLTLVAAILPVLGSQQCLQAWHWLFMNVLLFSLLPRFASNLRLVIAAVYVCSGLSRIAEFPENGPAGLIVRQLLDFVGQSGADVETVRLGCHLTCGCEIIAGLALLFAGQFPQPAALTAVAMHLTLLTALGPFGLGHHPAVLLWNVQLLLLTPLLALTAPRQLSAENNSPTALRNSAPALFHWLFAISGLFGVADNWPSWQLYSSRPESWQLYIRHDQAKQLPASLQPWLSPTILNGWQPLSLDRCSFAATNSPLVPEDRFQAAVIDAVLQQIPNDTEFLIRISEPDPMRWWHRRERQIVTHQQLRLEMTRFILNATALPPHPKHLKID